MADALLQKGIYAIGLSCRAVPEGKARICTQVSAAQSRQELGMAIEAFADVKRKLQV